MQVEIVPFPNKNMVRLRVLSVVFIILMPTIQSITFDNGYHIVVAINKNVAENLDILTQLQTAMTSASMYMYQTTRHLSYIQTVTILVPETWAKRPEWTVSSLTFKEADIRVDTPHPAMGNSPYTFQPGLCGEEGRYIHLTPDFVLDNGVHRDLYYGDFGRLLVHEFAHLRFGVFDEYGERGSTQHPVYYLDGGSLRPTACSREINGTFIDFATNRICSLGDDGKLLADNCDFLVNRSVNKATSSVMFAQFLEEVTSFCETDPSDPKIRHNADAPNKHNKMCNNRGTWDIIREHPDIKYSSPNIILDTTPTFQVVQRQIQKVKETEVCGRRFVFVLDVSGSMTNNDRYFKLRQMADKIIRDILPVGSEVGIVVFSDDARVWTGMRFLVSDSERQMLAAGLPTPPNFGSFTAIGKGLLKGIELLEEANHTAAGGRIFLITDGNENVDPYVKSILVGLVQKGVVVHTLAYSEAAAEILAKLSSVTGGQYSYFDESDKSTQLDGAAQRLLYDVSICEYEGDVIEIDRRAALLDSTETTYERTVLIDSTVGNNTLFVFTLSLGARTQVSLRDPLGNIYHENSSNYEVDTTLNIIRFRFALAEAGHWIYNLQKGSLDDESVVGVVKSHPRSPVTLPYKIDSWVGKMTFDAGTDQDGLAIYAYVHQGYSHIIGIEVRAVVSWRTGTTEKVLQDNGLFPDNTAEDGVYTNVLIGFKSNSRYSLEVTVKSNSQAAIVRSGSPMSGRALRIYSNESNPVVYEPVEPFNRISSLGAVDIKGLDQTLDQFDPSRVTDLEAIISDRNSRHVTLTWTAPGDDLNEGTVTRYDIRMATTFEDLRGNFSDSYEIQSTDIREGTDTPVPAGSLQNMTVSLPGHMKTENFVFGLKAIDDSNRTSELSNLKAVTFEEIILPETPRTTTTTTTTTTSTSPTTTTTLTTTAATTTTATTTTTSTKPTSATRPSIPTKTMTTSTYTPEETNTESHELITTPALDSEGVNTTGLIISTSLAGVILGLVVSTVICLLFFKRRRSQKYHLSTDSILPY